LEIPGALGGGIDDLPELWASLEAEGLLPRDV
jgi:hypothetical protein